MEKLGDRSVIRGLVLTSSPAMSVFLITAVNNTVGDAPTPISVLLKRSGRRSGAWWPWSSHFIQHTVALHLAATVIVRPTPVPWRQHSRSPSKGGIATRGQCVVRPLKLRVLRNNLAVVLRNPRHLQASPRHRGDFFIPPSRPSSTNPIDDEKTPTATHPDPDQYKKKVECVRTIYLSIYLT